MINSFLKFLNDNDTTMMDGDNPLDPRETAGSSMFGQEYDDIVKRNG